MPRDAAAAPTLPLMQATAPDGTRFELLIDRIEDVCVVLRDGERIFDAPTSIDGIDAAVDLVMEAVEPGFRRLGD